MNVWAAFAAFAFGLFVNWGILAYYAGRQTKAIETANTRLDGHSTWIREVSTKVNDQDGRINRIEEWKEAQQRRA
jgi:hypothetical protein